MCVRKDLCEKQEMELPENFETIKLERFMQKKEEVDEKYFVNGDVLVFDIEKSKLLGGFVLNIKSNTEINVGEGDDVNSELVASLTSKVREEIKQKFRDLTPFLEVKYTYNF